MSQFCLSRINAVLSNVSMTWQWLRPLVIFHSLCVACVFLVVDKEDTSRKHMSTSRYPNSRATQREVLNVYAAVQRRCFVDTLLKAAHIETTGPAWKTQKGATLPKRKDLSAFAESGECPVCRKQVYAMEELVVERVK